MARVQLENVNKIYRSGRGEVHAVKDINLDIKDGEFVSLVGPSGCGKTSTLRMIVGLEDISSGTIRFDGRRVNDLEPRDRNVAMAFETYALYPNMTIEENMAFPLEVRGVPAAERRRQVHLIAETLKLEDILDQKPGALSGGQQQRVSLGRALIRDPAVFILDEVMSHSDTSLKFQMLLDLKRVHLEVGKTMIYVTHDQMEALALSDRIAVMDHAVLQQVGTRDELYNTPANTFVADFIGEPPTNFFNVRLRENGGNDVLQCEESGLEFVTTPERFARLKESGAGNAVMGIRPQDFHLGADGAAESIHTEVFLNEYLGERSILTLRGGSKEFRALAPPTTSTRAGEGIILGYAPENVMIFNRTTGTLIN